MGRPPDVIKEELVSEQCLLMRGRAVPGGEAVIGVIAHGTYTSAGTLSGDPPNHYRLGVRLQQCTPS